MARERDGRSVTAGAQRRQPGLPRARSRRRGTPHPGTRSRWQTSFPLAWFSFGPLRALISVGGTFMDFTRVTLPSLHVSL